MLSLLIGAAGAILLICLVGGFFITKAKSAMSIKIGKMIIFILLVTPISSNCEIISWIDTNGVRHWSNKEAPDEADIISRVQEIQGRVEPYGHPQKTIALPCYDTTIVQQQSRVTYNQGALPYIIKAEMEILGDKKERLEDVYWREKASPYWRGNKISSKHYRHFKEELQERKEELKDSPKTYLYKHRWR